MFGYQKSEFYSEEMASEFIHMELPQGDRLKRLNAIAIRQMQTLTARTAKQLKEE